MGTGKTKVHLIDFSCLSLFILSISFSVFTVFHQCNPPHSLCLFSALPQERRPNSPSVFVLMWSICGLMSSMITVFTATHTQQCSVCVCVWVSDRVTSTNRTTRTLWGRGHGHTRSVSSGSRSSFYWSSNTSLIRFKSSSASLWKNSPSPELCKHFPDGFMSSVIAGDMQ